VPENELVAYEEMTRIDNEIRGYRSARDLQSTARTEAGFDSIRTAAASGVASAQALNCTLRAAQDSAPLLMQRLSSIANRIYYLYPGSREDDPWNALRPMRGGGSASQATCRALQVALGPSTHQRALLDFVEVLRRENASTIRQSELQRRQLDSLVARLESRRAALQNRLNSGSPQQQLSKNLWQIVLVIGLLSLAAIAQVKLFDATVQLEWVASGQVIQFVTVMILLSSIMALGLAGILKENTLGTLLGGIAGYVLSQGVGRAVAREVSRRLNPGDQTAKKKKKKKAPVTG
jgi:hypothetical protein